MISGGQNIGRVGIVSHVSTHDAGFDIVHIRDGRGKNFATRTTNVFVVGEDKKTVISLPKGKGIAFNILEEAENRKKRK